MKLFPRLHLKLPALGLRGKLAATSLVLATLPWVGWLYVEQLERFLMEAQSQALMGTARAIATALHDRPWLLGAHAVEPKTQAEEELRQLAIERSNALGPAASTPPQTPPPATPAPAAGATSPDAATLAGAGGGTASPSPPRSADFQPEGEGNPPGIRR